MIKKKPERYFLFLNIDVLTNQQIIIKILLLSLIKLICTKVFKKLDIPNVCNDVFKISTIGNMKI